MISTKTFFQDLDSSLAHLTNLFVQCGKAICKITRNNLWTGTDF